MAYKVEIDESEFKASFEELSGNMKVKDLYASLADKYKVLPKDIQVACKSLNLTPKRFYEKTEIVFVKSTNTEVNTDDLQLNQSVSSN